MIESVSEDLEKQPYDGGKIKAVAESSHTKAIFTSPLVISDPIET